MRHHISNRNLMFFEHALLGLLILAVISGTFLLTRKEVTVYSGAEPVLPETPFKWKKVKVGDVIKCYSFEERQWKNYEVYRIKKGLMIVRFFVKPIVVWEV